MKSANVNKEILEYLSSKKNEPSWLKEKRLRAFNLYKELQYPDLKYGLHLTSTLDNLSLEQLNLDLDFNFITKYKDNITVEDLNKAILSKDLEKYFMTLVRYDENKFTAFHAASFANGVFIHIPKGFKAKHAINLNLNLNSRTQIYNIIILAEPSSSATIVEKSSPGKKDGFRSEIVEIFAKESSDIKFVSMQNLSDNSYNLSIKRAKIEKDANVEWIDCNVGAKLNRVETTSLLSAEGAKTKNYNIFFSYKNQNFDFLSTSIHENKDTKSSMLVKGALNDRARAICRGLIHIKNKAHGSDGYQKIDALLLSNNTSIEPVPKLEIDNNDVKCGHSASIGQIDDDKLFYLMSRGLNEELARTKLVEGFFDLILKEIPIADIRDSLRNLITKRI